MAEYTEMFNSLKFIHIIIATILLFVLICLNIGFRPFCLFASLTLVIFLFDYALQPYRFGLIYQALTQWMPVLFELSVFYGTIVVTRFFDLSQPWSTILFFLCIVRSISVVYYRLLPINDTHRVYIEKNLEKLCNLFLREFSTLVSRLFKMCYTENQGDDNEIEKFKLDQINSMDSVVNEHDETIHRLQKIAAATTDLSSPVVTNIECPSTATPPVRRHHARILHQHDASLHDELDPPRTPITPAHPSSSMAKMLHNTSGSYTGPVTRNRARTGSNISTTTTSPVKSKQPTELTFLVCKRNEEKSQ